MQDWTTYESFKFPEYKNAVLHFKSDTESFEIPFLVSPQSYNVSQSYSKNVVSTLNGWHISSAGNGPTAISIQGKMMDSYHLQERLFFLNQYLMLMRNSYTSLKEYVNPYEQSLEIEGVLYRGLVANFSFQKSMTNPFLYSYSLTFYAVEQSVVDTSSLTVPPYASYRVKDGSSIHPELYMKDDELPLTYTNQNIASGSAIYESTDTGDDQKQPDGFWSGGGTIQGGDSSQESTTITGDQKVLVKIVHGEKKSVQSSKILAPIMPVNSKTTFKTDSGYKISQLYLEVDSKVYQTTRTVAEYRASLHTVPITRFTLSSKLRWAYYSVGYFADIQKYVFKTSEQKTESFYIESKYVKVVGV